MVLHLPSSLHQDRTTKDRTTKDRTTKVMDGKCFTANAIRPATRSLSHVSLHLCRTSSGGVESEETQVEVGLDR